MPQRSDKDLAAKIQQYEVFLNDVLKVDLGKANQCKASLQAELQEFEDLERNLQLLQKVQCSSRSGLVCLSGRRSAVA